MAEKLRNGDRQPLEFRILGPLQILRGDEPVPLPGPRPRALLAYLLLHHDELVTADRLVDALWESDPPPTARKMIRMHASELRRLLELDHVSGTGLLSEGGGYRLRLGCAQLDCDLFDQQVGAGREALRAGDAPRAAQMLAAALGLWRGPAVADLRAWPLGRAEAERLDELRLAAVEEEVEAQLALGRLVAIVPRLERLVAEHPLRERLRGQLMVALYRGGRQADALRVYRETRRVLVDQLGIEPAPSLQRLEQAILRQDPALEVSPVPEPPLAGLPAPQTRLIGRTREVAAIIELVRAADARLVTLVGAGGSGKTRLALEAIGVVVADRKVVFVPLDTISGGTTVPDAIAAAMGASVPVDGSVADAVASAIGDVRTLLVLDSFEHVASQAGFLAELLARSPALQLLATSREALHLSAERVFDVPPLELPDLAADPAQLPANEAVMLFAERATAVRSDFELTAENVRDVASICIRLDGLPLALELAAARMRLYPPRQMLEQLARPLDLLIAGPRDLPARQQTLEATIDWSHSLLSAAEQRLFAELSVFAGGFRPEAAEAVADATLAALGSLADKSLLVQSEDPDGTLRFRMLETLRAFARARLEERGTVSEVARRHVNWVCGLVEAAEPNLWGGEAEQSWLERLEADYANLRAAIAWTATAGDRETLLRLAACSWRFWFLRGYVVEGRRWLEHALASAAGSREARAKALRGAAVLALKQGDLAEAHKRAHSSLDLHRQLGDQNGVAGSLNLTGIVATSTGDLALAAENYAEAAAIRRRTGDRWGLAATLVNLANLASLRGDHQGSRRLEEEALAEFTALNDKEGIAICRYNLGVSALRSGDVAESAVRFRSSLTVASELGHKEVIAACLEGLAAVATRTADDERGAVLLGAAEVVRQNAGLAPEPDEDVIRGLLAALRARAGEPAIDLALNRGRQGGMATGLLEAGLPGR